MVQKLHQRQYRILQHLLRRQRPGHGDQRDQEALQEVVAVAPGRQVGGDAELAVLGFRQHLARLAVELDHLEEHLEEAPAPQIFEIAKAIAQAMGHVLQAIGLDLEAEAHRAVPIGHLQLLEQAHEERIGGVVEHHEGGIEAHGLSAVGHRHRVRVSADVVVLLVESEVEPLVQEMAACEAGRAGADDSYGGFCHGLLLLYVLRFDPSRSHGRNEPHSQL